MGSADGAAKARAIFLARLAAGEIAIRVGASGVVRPLIPAQRVYLSPVTPRRCSWATSCSCTAAGSWAAIWEARARLLAREKVCRVAA